MAENLPVARWWMSFICSPRHSTFKTCLNSGTTSDTKFSSTAANGSPPGPCMNTFADIKELSMKSSSQPIRLIIIHLLI